MNKNKTDMAFKSYTEGKISMGKAAEVAGMSIWEFLDLMKERKIHIRYDLEDLKEDIEWGLNKD